MVGRFNPARHKIGRLINPTKKGGLKYGWLGFFLEVVENFLYGGEKVATSSEIYQDAPKKSDLQSMIYMLSGTFRQLAFHIYQCH